VTLRLSQHQQAREDQTMQRQLEAFFNPDGVAIIGASSNPDKLSHGVVRNLKRCGYQGAIYPINPKGGELLGLKVYPSILDVPDPVDLAVVMIPAPYVPQALQECGLRGLKAVIVITGGFREAGEKGAAAERQLKEIADRHGMRLIGPNCVGVMDAHLPLDTTFITAMPRPGHIAFVSHSGAICGGAIDWARQMGVGYSRIASLGNQVDVDIADGIAMMYQDPNTHVISVYAEGLPQGRRFIEAAAGVFREKPIVMLKAGLTSAGTRAVASHTGALAGNEQAYLAACERAGVLVVESLQEQNDIAIALAAQPLPSGNRVALLTNAGGPAALAADELDRRGLSMANLKAATIEQLQTVTPRDAQLGNPVDMLGGPSAEMYLEAGKLLLADPNVDMLMAIFVPQAITPVEEVARNVIAVAEQTDKPVVCCLVGGASIGEAMRILNEHDVPCYQDPNHAARGLSGLLRYQQRRHRPLFTPTTRENIDRESAYAVLKAAWEKQGDGMLNAEDAAAVAQAYGISAPRAGLASTPEAAISLANAIGYPVALKLVAPGVVHKADVGGVALNIDEATEVHKVSAQMISAFPDAQVMVQQMTPPGLEVIIGTQRDPQFGQLVMFGLGGTLVEVLKDVAFRLAPLSEDDAEAMIAETAAGQLMQGVRGQASADSTAVIDALGRVGLLVHDFPCISEMDINPLIVGASGEGALAVDVRIVLDQRPVAPSK
jgi:acetate---CoA ligase (ADP-forming)